MKRYPDNSPQAMARLLTSLMAADDRIDDAQVEALHALDAYARLDITPSAFADVLRDYFADLKDADIGVPAGAGLAAVVDSPIQAGIIDQITDPEARRVLWEIMVGLARATGEIDPAESRFLRRVAERWWSGHSPDPLPAAGAEITPCALPVAAKGGPGECASRAAAL